MDPLKRVLEEAAREALIAHFEKLGPQFSNLHPTIRGDYGARCYLDRRMPRSRSRALVRLVAMADQFNLTDEQKEYALVKAYEQHGERLAQIRGGQRPRSGRGYFAALPDRSVRGPRARWPSKFEELTVQRLWRFSATPGAKTGRRCCTGF